MGFISPTDNLFLQLTFEGCQRLYETKITKKEPITFDMLDLSQIQDLSYKIRWKKFQYSRFEIFSNMFISAFAGFLYIEELLDVKLKKHIKIQDSHLEMIITKSKSDHHTERHVVYISRIQQQSSRGVLQKRSATLLKKRLWHRCFAVNFAKFT